MEADEGTEKPDGETVPTVDGDDNDDDMPILPRGLAHKFLSTPK